jgi:transcriptional regulator with XRE-family HTH domain
MSAYGVKKGAFANYLANQIRISEISQKDIAEALGYENANIVSMFKNGLTKVPIEKVPALAKALHLDPAHLLMMAMREYMPEAFAVIQATLGHTLTNNELALITEVRKATKESDPVFSKDHLAKIRAVVSSFH